MFPDEMMVECFTSLVAWPATLLAPPPFSFPSVACLPLVGAMLKLHVEIGVIGAIGGGVTASNVEESTDGL